MTNEKQPNSAEIETTETIFSEGIGYSVTFKTYHPDAMMNPGAASQQIAKSLHSAFREMLHMKLSVFLKNYKGFRNLQAEKSANPVNTGKLSQLGYELESVLIGDGRNPGESRKGAGDFLYYVLRDWQANHKDNPRHALCPISIRISRLGGA